MQFEMIVPETCMYMHTCRVDVFCTRLRFETTWSCQVLEMLLEYPHYKAPFFLFFKSIRQHLSGVTSLVLAQLSQPPNVAGISTPPLEALKEDEHDLDDKDMPSSRIEFPVFLDLTKIFVETL